MNVIINRKECGGTRRRQHRCHSSKARSLPRFACVDRTYRGINEGQSQGRQISESLPLPYTPPRIIIIMITGDAPSSSQLVVVAAALLLLI